MSFPVPEYSRSKVNRAGQILISDESSQADIEWALLVLNNWRACHGYPINTFQATLRGRLEGVDENALVAQRLKRSPSILLKLKRNPSMDLARMQDIGGLRAIVRNQQRVERLAEMYRKGGFKHELVGEKNYILTPKPDGYRSIHLIFKYKNERATAYEGLQLELQIRTKLQHAWATAVETAGTFLNQALKANQGEKKYLDFFALTSSAFCHLEDAPLVPGYEGLNREQTFKQVARDTSRLKILDILSGFSAAANFINREKRDSAYYLVRLNTDSKSTTIQAFRRDQLELAIRSYSEVERIAASGEPVEAVLVRTGSINDLKKAYPNYFLDTHEFIRQIEAICKEASN